MKFKLIGQIISGILAVLSACIGLALLSACAEKDVPLWKIQNEKTLKWGYADEKNRVVISEKYDYAEEFGETPRLAAVYVGPMDGSTPGEGGTWGLIDLRGREVVPTGKYEYIGSFGENLAAAARDSKWGYIDSTGVEVLPFVYDEAGTFFEGLAAVNIGGSRNEIIEDSGWVEFSGGKWGYIDKTGQMIIPAEYDSADAFYEGRAMITIEDENGFLREGYIDRESLTVSLSSPPEPTVPSVYTQYAGSRSLGNGHTISITLTLQTQGDKKHIGNYKLSMSQSLGSGASRTYYTQEGFSPTPVGTDGTFSRGINDDELSGTVKTGRIDFTLSRSNGEKHTFTAYPEKNK